MSASPRHWFVLGAGSLGCLYAAYLQRAGIAATLLLRDAQRLREFRACGLTLQRDGAAHAAAVAARVAGAAAGPPIAHLLLCTKAHDSRAALAAVRAQLAPDAVVALLQNGMGVREELQPLLPRAQFVHALSTEGARQPRRFSVVHAGRGETAVGGGPAAAALAADLARSGLRALAVDDIERRRWQKLAVNCAINPLTALHRCRNGELLQLPGLAAHIDAVCAEIAAVAAAAGVALQGAELAGRVAAVIRATAANRSSMLQDVAAGRATEIDYLNGFVARSAQRHGLAAPVNAALAAAVAALPGAPARP